jgi:hypothetical protein
VQEAVGAFMPYASRFRSLGNVGAREIRDGPKAVSTVEADGRACVDR